MRWGRVRDGWRWARRGLRRLRARWRLHRLEWNAQFRCLDEEFLLYDKRTWPKSRSESPGAWRRGWRERWRERWPRWRVLWRETWADYRETWRYGVDDEAPRPSKNAAQSFTSEPTAPPPANDGAGNTVWPELRQRLSRTASQGISELRRQWEQLERSPPTAQRPGGQSTEGQAPGGLQALAESRIRAFRESLRAFSQGFSQGQRDYIDEQQSQHGDMPYDAPERPREGDAEEDADVSGRKPRSESFEGQRAAERAEGRRQEGGGQV